MFGAGTRQRNVDSDEYAPMRLDEDDKTLQEGSIETDGLQQEFFILSKSLRRTNLMLKIIIGLLSVAIVALLSINVPDTVRKMTSSSQRLIKSPVPDISTEKVVFEKHPVYADRPNEVSDRAWDKLLPPGRGFVFIKDWDTKYGLPPGQETEWGMIYSVAVFHQMHCLGQLRRFSWMFLDAIGKNDTAAMAKIKFMFVENDHKEHMSHCFDYLRQTIQCGGDMAMEWPRTEPDGRRIAVDGWGIAHECKNWGTIMDYMDKNHFDHSMVQEIAPLMGSIGKS